MKRTRNILLTFFCLPLLASAVLYICGDFAKVDLTVFYDVSAETQFVLSTFMILLTLALVPLSLRLFKFKSVAADLTERKETALAKWGVLRLLMLGGLLLVNTFLYYAFGYEPTYGYLAVVVLLCMPFVAPTMNRCKSETGQ